MNTKIIWVVLKSVVFIFISFLVDAVISTGYIYRHVNEYGIIVRVLILGVYLGGTYLTIAAVIKKRIEYNKIFWITVLVILLLTLFLTNVVELLVLYAL